MLTIKKDFFGVSRTDEFYFYILTDIHDGIKPSRTDKLKSIVSEIAKDPERSFWVDLGDRFDLINRSDPRFTTDILADWLTISDLADIAKAQRNHYLDIVSPIAPQCVGLIEGNHEAMIKKHYERDIYLETVAGIKEIGKFPSDHNLAWGYSGWLVFNFYRKEQRASVAKIKCFLHHGHGGGQLAGGAALVLERILLRHNCDLALLGHNHRTFTLPVTVEEVNNGNRVVGGLRQGAFCGTFFDGIGYDTYASMKGYPALPVGYIKIILRPHSEAHQKIELIPQFP